MKKTGRMAVKQDYFFILAVLICTVLVSSSFKHIIFNQKADESYYLKYAAIVSEDGVKAFPGMFKDYIANQKDWVFPNPLRIAFILLSAVWIKIFGAAYMALASLSLFSYMLTLCISYYFCRKYFGENTALLFSVLMGFSPLAMGMARRALLDAPANLFLITSLWLFFDMLENRQALKYVLFTIIYSVAILMKESYVLLAPVFVCYLLIRKYITKKHTLQNDFLCATAYPAVIVAAVYMAVVGSLPLIISMAKIVISSPATHMSAVRYYSGYWGRYIIDFLLVSPWTILLAIAFIGRYFLSGKRDEKIIYFLTVLIAYYFILNLFAKNIRYAMLLDTPIRLFAVALILEFTGSRKGKYAYLYAPLIILAIVIYDYASFYKIFVIDCVYEPASAVLLDVREMAPFR